jgi:hypothetical protein
MDKAARYHRGRGAFCLELARHLSDPEAVKLMHEAVARHFARAGKIEALPAHVADPPVKRAAEHGDLGDSFYYRAIRGTVGEATRERDDKSLNNKREESWPRSSSRTDERKGEGG